MFFRIENAIFKKKYSLDLNSLDFPLSRIISTFNRFFDKTIRY